MSLSSRETPPPASAPSCLDKAGEASFKRRAIAGLLRGHGLSMAGTGKKRLGPMRPTSSWAAPLALVGAILLFFHAYLGRGLIGAGDIEHYAIQLADFVTQAGHGNFPVWTGQSEFAFNGNVHTLRTAPYHVHFGGLLYALTGGLAGFAGTVNLEILLSALGAGLLVFSLARRIGEESPWRAAFWGLIYVLAPATWLVIATRDMLTTYLAIPWLPLIWHGWLRFLDFSAPPRVPVAAVGGTAMLWWIHPPIAAWMSAIGGPLLAGGLIWHGKPVLRNWPSLFILGAAAVSISAYPVISVRGLELGYDLLDPASAVMANLTTQGLDAFRPFSTVPAGQTPPLQPGWSIWIVWILALLSWPRLGGGQRALTAVPAILGLLLLPWPEVTGAIWRHLPTALLDATNVWPGQRFYPIIAAAVVVTGVDLGARWPRAGRIRKLATLGLIACVAWSAWETRVLWQRTTATRSTVADTTLKLSPDNVKLGRSSYALFGTAPDYVSHGYMEPSFAFRLPLEGAPDTIASPNTAWLSAQPNESLPRPADGVEGFTASPDQAYLLTFEFPDASTGEIVIEGEGVRRNYLLPMSGGPTAFGSAPGTIRTIPFLPVTQNPAEYRVSSTVNGVRFTVKSAPLDDLPIRVHGFSPLRAMLNLGHEGMLATPVMWIPGYTATIDGAPTRIQRAPNGVLRVRVPAGRSRLEISYGPPASVALGYYSAIIAMLVVLSLAVVPTRPRSRLGLPPLRLWLTGGLFLSSGLGAVFSERDQQSRQLPLIRTGEGAIELSLDLLGMDRTTAQPLLEFGETGSADLIYIAFDAKGKPRIGVDHWGLGGPQSEPLPEGDEAVHILHVDTPALNDGSAKGRWTITWNGEIVLDEELPAYPDPDGFVQVGENTVGASTTVPKFSGIVVGVSQSKSPDGQPESDRLNGK